jgi:hypothetical protein
VLSVALVLELGRLAGLVDNSSDIHGLVEETNANERTKRPTQNQRYSRVRIWFLSGPIYLCPWFLSRPIYLCLVSRKVDHPTYTGHICRFQPKVPDKTTVFVTC